MRLPRRLGQRVEDFLAGRPSTHLGSVLPSYTPGVTPTDLSTCLPDWVIAAIREAIPAFDKKIPGFAMPGGILSAAIDGVQTAEAVATTILAARPVE